MRKTMRLHARSAARFYIRNLKCKTVSDMFPRIPSTAGVITIRPQDIPQIQYHRYHGAHGVAYRIVLPLLLLKQSHFLMGVKKNGYSVSKFDWMTKF
jgi:hypothetical protein